MSAKPETISFESIVTEAFARMKDTTAASTSYEVDRSNGQWVVRRKTTIAGIAVENPIVGAAVD